LARLTLSEVNLPDAFFPQFIWVDPFRTIIAWTLKAEELERFWETSCEDTYAFRIFVIIAKVQSQEVVVGTPGILWVQLSRKKTVDLCKDDLELVLKKGLCMSGEEN
jgi:hypothetical protein